MYKTLIFGALFCIATTSHASSINDALNKIEATWANTYYSSPAKNQSKQYNALLKTTKQLAAKHSDRAEPLIWQAIIVATNAEQQSGFDALEAIHHARNLLLSAIEINPMAMDGSAYVTLGSLYNMVPGWPIAFGDNDKAQQALLTALAINPDGIDSNYFYGEYLLSQGQNQAASKYFKKAGQALIRPEQRFADTQLKAEAQLGLENANARKISGIKNFFTNLFNSATAKAGN